MIPTHVLRHRLGEQTKRAELAEAAGQTYWAAKYRSLAAETTAELLTRRGGTAAVARAVGFEAGEGNPLRCVRRRPMEVR